MADLVTFIDIDERMKAETALKNSETRLKLALQSAKQGLWDWNLKTKEMFYSDEWINMIGYTRDQTEAVIDFWFNLIHPEDKNCVIELFNKHIENIVETYKTEYRLKNKEGNYIWVLDQGQVVERNEDGMALRAVGIQIDITERKKNEQKLRELNITKDKFFSIIAHDLKNPFNQFLGLSNLMLESFDTLSKDDLFEYILLLNNISEKTNNLLENLLDWSRSQTGRISYYPVIINLNEIINNIILLFENHIKDKEISLNLNLDDQPRAFADENMIKSVFRNLISNALKFTPKGGNISIEGIQENLFAKISIKDNGVGISPENLVHLFELDAHYTSEGTEHEKGTGLGLMLCKEFLEINKGSLKVESHINRGSIFTVYLPLENSENQG